MHKNIKTVRQCIQGGDIVKGRDDYKYSEVQKAAFAIVNRIKPTHFVTIQLRQNRAITSRNGWTVWERGDDAIYCKTYRSFIRALSKEIGTRTNRSRWQSHKQMIGNACVIEGGTRRTRNHLHMVLTKPDDIDEATFRLLIYRLTRDNGWIMDGSHRADIQSIESAGEKLRTTLYSTKKGIDRLLIA